MYTTVVVCYYQGKYAQTEKTANSANVCKRKKAIPCTLSGRFKLALVYALVFRDSPLHGLVFFLFGSVTEVAGEKKITYLNSYVLCVMCSHTQYVLYTDQRINRIHRKYIGNQLNIQNNNLV